MPSEGQPPVVQSSQLARQGSLPRPRHSGSQPTPGPAGSVPFHASAPPPFPTPPPSQYPQYYNMYPSNTPVSQSLPPSAEQIPHPRSPASNQNTTPEHAATPSHTSPSTCDKGKKREQLDRADAEPRKKAKTPVTKAKPKARKGSAKPASRSGRQAGSSNYTKEDIKILLDAVQKILPIGVNMWNTVTDIFNKKVAEIGCPTRTAKPLKSKFEQVC